MPEVLTATTKPKNKRRAFYVLFSIIAILAVMTGFLTTYTTPLLKGSFKAPAVVHIHGGFAFGWVLLFFVQSMAVRYKNFPLHRTLGYFSMFIALGIITTLIPVGLFQVKRDLAMGLGDMAISSILGMITTGLMFGGFVALGYFYRKKPRIHKRLLVLATIILIWPAWFRFRHYFPSVPRPDIWFGVVLSDSLILLCWLADWLTYRKIHPAFLYGGLFIIIENSIEIALFDSEPWRVVSKFIYQLVTS